MLGYTLFEALALRVQNDCVDAMDNQAVNNMEGQMTASQAEFVARNMGVSKGPRTAVPEQQLGVDNTLNTNTNNIPVATASPIDSAAEATADIERLSNKKKLRNISLLICVGVLAAVLIAATVATLYG